LLDIATEVVLVEIGLVSTDENQTSENNEDNMTSRSAVLSFITVQFLHDASAEFMAEHSQSNEHQLFLRLFRLLRYVLQAAGQALIAFVSGP
jgi:hypothetical protein